MHLHIPHRPVGTGPIWLTWSSLVCPELHISIILVIEVIVFEKWNKYYSFLFSCLSSLLTLWSRSLRWHPKHLNSSASVLRLYSSFTSELHTGHFISYLLISLPFVLFVLLPVSYCVPISSFWCNHQFLAVNIGHRYESYNYFP